MSIFLEPGNVAYGLLFSRSSELSVKIQLYDDDELYPAIQSLQKSKPAYLQ